MTNNAHELRRVFTSRYVIGLLLIAALALASLYIMYQQTARQIGRAELVSLASTQKALSQRIAFFSNALVATDDEVERDVLRNELNAAIDHMSFVHDRLSLQGPASRTEQRSLKTVHGIYFNEASPFDVDMRIFLDSARQLKNAASEELTSDSILLRELNLLGMNTIMQTHDVITRILTFESEKEIAHLQFIQSVLLGFIVLLLLVEAVLIFEPMGRMIEVSVQKVKRSERFAQQEAERAKQADEAKSQFLRVMSHELRTPLNAIIGMAELFKATPLNEQQKGYLGHIKSASDHMLTLANDILLINQHAAGHVAFHAAPTNLRAAVQQTAGMLKLKAEEKGLSLEAKIPDAADAEYEFDAQRFRQILLNLIGNALKFTHEGGIEVNVEVKQGQADKVFDVFVRVKDTGIGIPADKQERIFEEFEQAEALGARNYGGAGLGLAISRKLAKGMGGTLQLERSDENGSVFALRLPLRRIQSVQKTPSPPNDMAQIQHGAAEPMTVLITDDHLPNRLIIEAFLKSAGCQIVFATNGREAIERCQENPDIDLAFMDIEMPEMDGATATKALRARSGAESRIPIVALTAHALPQDKENLLAAGFNDVLRKPASREELLRCFDQYARGKAA